jgi:hypothetical protein
VRVVKYPTATVSAAVIPFVASLLTVVSSSDAPSLNALSVASVSLFIRHAESLD